MKNVKLGLFTLLGLVGVASAFTNAPKHFAGTTYYAVTDNAGSFTWTKTQPQLTCQATNIVVQPYCTIVTKGSFHPTNGVVPTSSQATLIGTAGRDYK